MILFHRGGTESREKNIVCHCGEVPAKQNHSALREISPVAGFFQFTLLKKNESSIPKLGRGLTPPLRNSPFMRGRPWGDFYAFAAARPGHGGLTQKYYAILLPGLSPRTGLLGDFNFMFGHPVHEHLTGQAELLSGLLLVPVGFLQFRKDPFPFQFGNHLH